MDNLFNTWRDLIITPAVEVVIFMFAALLAWKAGTWLQLDGLGQLVFLLAAVSAVTLVVLFGMRRFFPIRPGIYSYRNDAFKTYTYNLYSFLCFFNLYPFYFNSILPPPLRKYFYQLLGARMGKGVICIAGRISDLPHLVTIAEGAMLGDDVLLLPHAVTFGSDPALVLASITVERGAIVGARSVVMPGVYIGAGATVAAMSFVKMNTRIPAHEIWGGCPAVKLGESQPPSGRESRGLSAAAALSRPAGNGLQPGRAEPRP